MDKKNLKWPEIPNFYGCYKSYPPVSADIDNSTNLFLKNTKQEFRVTHNFFDDLNEWRTSIVTLCGAHLYFNEQSKISLVHHEDSSYSDILQS